VTKALALDTLRPITATLPMPTGLAGPGQLRTTLDITAIPTVFLKNAPFGIEEVAKRDFELKLIARVETPATLAPAIFSLIQPGLYGQDLREIDHYGGQPYFSGLVAGWSSGGSFPIELQDFAEYVAYGETVIVEESPPRRTSPAAVAATKLASAVIVPGAPSTAAVLAHSGASPCILIVGTGITLLLATGAAGLVIASHWLGKRLEV
jgi:hypothetical protein